MGNEALVLGELGHQDTDGTADHGVLSHKDDTTTTESLTDLVHLLGGDLFRGMSVKMLQDNRELV